MQIEECIYLWSRSVPLSIVSSRKEKGQCSVVSVGNHVFLGKGFSSTGGYTVLPSRNGFSPSDLL